MFRGYWILAAKRHGYWRDTGYLPRSGTDTGGILNTGEPEYSAVGANSLNESRGIKNEKILLLFFLKAVLVTFSIFSF